MPETDMKTLARKILASKVVDEDDAARLAEMVLDIRIMRCGTCQESNLIDKPEAIGA